MAIINPTINLVARPGMSLPKPWVFTRNGSELTTAQIAKVSSGLTEIEKKAFASRGTYITATTTLGIEEANKLRHDYSSKKDNQYAGTYNGFLVEAFSENLLMTQTSAIPCRNLTTWTKSTTGTVEVVSGAGITDKSDVTASGSNNATKLVASSGNSVSVSYSVTGLTVNTIYTLSAYFKKSDKSSVAVPKIALGGVETATAPAIAGLSASRAVSDPYNWILLTSKFKATATTMSVVIKASDAPVLVDRVQLEIGNNTSTILESSKIRAAENLYYAGNSDNTKLVDPFEGTVYVMCRVQENVENIAGLKVGICQLGQDTARRIVIRAESGTATSPNWTIYGTLANGPELTDTYSQSATFTIANAAWPQDDWLKIAVRYRAGESNTIRMSVNGNPVVYCDPLGTLKTNLENYGVSMPTSSINEANAFLRLGKVRNNVSGASQAYDTLDGSIMHFAYFPKALSDEDLVALTS